MTEYDNAPRPPQSYLTDAEWNAICVYFGGNGRGTCQPEDLKRSGDVVKQLQELANKYKSCTKKGICYLCGTSNRIAAWGICQACYSSLRNRKLRTGELMRPMHLNQQETDGSERSCLCCGKQEYYAQGLCRNCYAAYRYSKIKMSVTQFAVCRRAALQLRGELPLTESTGSEYVPAPRTTPPVRAEKAAEICIQKIPAGDKELLRVLLESAAAQKGLAAEVEISKAAYAEARDIPAEEKEIRRDIGKILNENVVWLPAEGDGVSRSFRWLQGAQIKRNSVVLSLNEWLRGSSFAQAVVSAEKPLETKSKYSARMYAYCLEHRPEYRIREQNGQPYTVTLRQLTKALDCPLVTWTDIKRYVLDKAKDDLNGKSDVTFDYEICEKKGKRVVAIALKIEYC